MQILYFTGILILPFLNLTFVNAQVYIRLNQAGYLPGDTKIAVAFSNDQIRGSFEVINLKSGKTVFEAPLKEAETKCLKCLKCLTCLKTITSVES